MLLPAFLATGIVLLGTVVIAGALLGARARAQAAADAAALAAAPVTFRPFGAAGSATDEARRYAEFHGARLVACSCPHDPTFERRVVSVSVGVEVRLPLAGVVVVPATARAEFAPAELLVP